jgi:hypothetical protein
LGPKEGKIATGAMEGAGVFLGNVVAAAIRALEENRGKKKEPMHQILVCLIFKGRDIMEESIETSVPATVVWQAWERFRTGERGKTGHFKYTVLEVEEGKKFSILWKTLFARLIFTHVVDPTPQGSRIRYQVTIRGPFAWPLKVLIGKKLRRNIAALLRSFVSQLERS